jgi:hypothetical protein
LSFPRSGRLPRFVGHPNWNEQSLGSTSTTRKWIYQMDNIDNYDFDMLLERASSVF